MKITREIVSDLWPIYVAGDASGDTRALVEEFLKQDHGFARLLNDKRADDLLKLATPVLPPDLEAKALSRAKQRLRVSNWLFFVAMLFSFLAFGRVVADTSWDVSPRPFITMASIAAGFWLAFFVRLFVLQKKVLADRSHASRQT